MRRRKPAVSRLLIDRIGESLAAVDDARTELARVVARRAPLRERRAAHASLRHAFDDADMLLRRATTMARPRSYLEWSQWRHRLSSLDHARQIHLLDEQDEWGLLPIGSVRAIDTGMSGPDLGDLQHGDSRAPGTIPSYGLDLEAMLTDTVDDVPAAGGHPKVSVVAPRHQRTLEQRPAVTLAVAPPDEAA